MKTLRVAYPAYWGNLEPALQHTSFADDLLANEFEPLVKEGSGGSIVPGLAEAWTVSSDFRRFTFRLREGVHFSNGALLTAAAVKSSWEEGLRLHPKSANSSVQDVLYLVDGYDQFQSSDALRGVRVEGTHTVHVDFVQPFRTALSEFATGRMSVFLRVDGRAIGTGPYVIETIDVGHVRMTRNQHSPDTEGFPEVSVVTIPMKDAVQSIIENRIDLYAFLDANSLNDLSAERTRIGVLHGNESHHIVADLNGLPERFFSNAQHRLALQYLVHSALRSEAESPRPFARARLDCQVYLPLQAGRISDERTCEIIEKGAPYVEEFLCATKASPLYIVTSPQTVDFIRLLRGLGVSVREDSGVIESGQRLNMFYKTFEADIVLAGSSVAMGDPDGLFHLLASDGAITSPMIARPRIDRLLRDGRSITDPGELDPHYRLVTEAVLEDVPFVHLGFARDVFIYNMDRVAIAKDAPAHESRSLGSFIPA